MMNGLRQNLQPNKDARDELAPRILDEV